MSIEACRIRYWRSCGMKRSVIKHELMLRRKPAASSQNGPEFPLFMRLPAEIRYRIWCLVCPILTERRRVFHFKLVSVGRRRGIKWALTHGDWLEHQRRPLATLLQVHHESRTIVLANMPDALSVDVPEFRSVVVRFRKETDVIAVYPDSAVADLWGFPGPGRAPLSGPDEIQQRKGKGAGAEVRRLLGDVQHLAINVNFDAMEMRVLVPLFPALASLPQLKAVYFIWAHFWDTPRSHAWCGTEYASSVTLGQQGREFRFPPWDMRTNCARPRGPVKYVWLDPLKVDLDRLIGERGIRPKVRSDHPVPTSLGQLARQHMTLGDEALLGRMDAVGMWPMAKFEWEDAWADLEWVASAADVNDLPDDPQSWDRRLESPTGDGIAQDDDAGGGLGGQGDPQTNGSNALQVSVSAPGNGEEAGDANTEE